MSKATLLLFLLVNMTLLTVKLTPIVIVSLKGYKKLYNYRRIDKFKISLFSNNQTKYVTLTLFTALLALLFKHQSSKTNSTLVIISGSLIILTLFFSSETLTLTLINLCCLLQLMKSLNSQIRNKLRKKLGIIQAQSILLSEEQLNSYLQVPQFRHLSRKMI